MNATPHTYTPRECMATQALAARLLPKIRQVAITTDAEQAAGILRSGESYPIFRLEARRRWWPLSLLFAPHTRGLRLDPKAFAFVLRKGGLHYYRLEPVLVEGVIDYYWVARWNPAQAPEPSAITTEQQEPSPPPG